MRRRREAAEAVDESFWGRPGKMRFPLTGSYVVDGLVLTVGALAALLAPRMTDRQLATAGDQAYAH